jgi:hypothetical protein
VKLLKKLTSLLQQIYLFQKYLIFPLGCFTGPNECCYVTEDDSNITKKCIFPFKFNDVEYHGCVADDEFVGKFWCSTKVNKEGKHVSGFWGHCGRGCYIDPKNNSECIK